MGFEASLRQRMAANVSHYYCNFYISNITMYSIVVEHQLHKLDNKVYCELPPPISGLLRQRNDIRYLSMSLSNRATKYPLPNVTSSSASFNLSDNTDNTSAYLFPPFHVLREHAMHRRRFNLSLCTMVNNLTDPLLTEWIVYHILLGVEHFYIFDNSKDRSGSSKYSTLRPFLNANLITLIDYPFSPAKGLHWNSVQVLYYLLIL